MLDRIGDTTARVGGSDHGPAGTLASFAGRSSTTCIASLWIAAASGHGCVEDTPAARSIVSQRSASADDTPDAPASIAMLPSS